MENFLGQQRTIACQLSESHKLHNVSRDSLPCPLTGKNLIVSVQRVHLVEVCGPNANDDNGEGRVRGVDDRLSCFRHVRDLPVGEDEQDCVLLRLDRIRTRDGVCIANDLSKVGGTEERYVRQGCSVCVQNALHPQNARVGSIAIEGEAVRYGAIGEASAEAEHVKLLVCIVLLEDLTNSNNGLLVVIPACWVHVVKGVREVDVAVACSEVDGDHHVDLATSGYVLEERWGMVDLSQADHKLPPVLVWIL
mmetsp:Transcript_48377/g.151681  ORF Transcript_48377/g.151681 Transcript_48377/m.151681 type:complete len:250 (+) Transcript_48377:474-1223(+)